MLSGSWKTVGIGCVKYSGIYFWVQEFSSSANTGRATSADDSIRPVSIDIVNYNIGGYTGIQEEKPHRHSSGSPVPHKLPGRMGGRERSNYRILRFGKARGCLYAYRLRQP